MKDPDPRATCADVESLLPLFVGGDLDAEDLTLVSVHVAGCRDCAAGLEAARAARHELRQGLTAGLEGREPQLWPAIRAELQQEGLLGPQGVAAPAPLRPVPSVLDDSTADAPPVRRAGLPRVAAGLAAGIAAVLLIGQGLQGPATTPGDRPGDDRVLVDERGPAGPVPGVLAPGSALADAAPAPATPTAPAAGGLRPVGFDSGTLFDEAREDLLQDAARQGALPGGSGIFMIQPDDAGSGAQLTSGFKLQ